jgi:hypothetical protein
MILSGRREARVELLEHAITLRPPAQESLKAAAKPFPRPRDSRDAGAESSIAPLAGFAVELFVAWLTIDRDGQIGWC